jgi:hypothetical protein
VTAADDTVVTIASVARTASEALDRKFDILIPKSNVKIPRVLGHHHRPPKTGSPEVFIQTHDPSGASGQAKSGF